ncbi:tRNA (uridine(34)/cytosine(34)/5-carboxymethylaminomethyluridine(34)-2'-O)-methyltransferase TrmL [Cellvibrio japonicus]|uniref:tRNA (cytidine(34)-2'-O)-methyltransferase n=1 Tax=Cellvibrio japonicus (strain Ueda107) TaxID=498211 RepID=B3PKD4_CELJU|nr:tRNA (uridine(34)/cytosine(34)/5-carboxymethylaminomethyluridine(34)-2'-O)-methyltransferase TrmL [Cellvibrio japonicus]ACE86100.1 RNA methyltransferase, TrmH family, group 2 [Cellvibrio japonicus Ueda107]QEI12805.1 tRNA (uridine(34)/cytosine(34)/5-carboxymethylaminomethyluridine(34)-2'-O)-methyltransferase TrmL [Cellvibrio japonicus]QEI16379.1 tRNA (uridine(34)/cytosine(34)/5-carboxymethylaminomethyluridine(34)-2'-O)-methyltransferase TrmL [Cellvibrio japonicus]QEI19957.1 tRNA (uridine(34)/
MFHIVLFEPEIPPNTGNIIRLAANTGCQLHLIEPLGFNLDEKSVTRAGMDYAETQDVRIHASWEHFLVQEQPTRLFALSTKGSQCHSDAQFAAGDYLLFGPESRGLPADIRESLPANQVLRIPMAANSRSMNLSNAVAVMVYEAWRQLGYAGAL